MQQKYQMHTLLTTGQLATFASDFSVEALRKGVDEFKDVRITACSLDLRLGNLFMGLVRAEQDVEADGARVERLEWMIRI